VLGTDDVHYYYTDQSLHALEAARDDFTIALVHSPELFDFAAEAGVALYLTGHTHGGQVCLPGGHAPLKHLRSGRHLFTGHWRHGEMQGSPTRAPARPASRSVQHAERDPGAAAGARLGGSRKLV
jgi:hypothetical protein